MAESSETVPLSQITGLLMKLLTFTMPVSPYGRNLRCFNAHLLRQHEELIQ
jgi:hypothetical protein